MMWVAKLCSSNHIFLTRWELVRKAGVEHVILHPLVNEAVVIALNMLMNE